nr:helix-turn-helix domain-containing protein [uncultured Halomonas sp.]
MPLMPIAASPATQESCRTCRLNSLCLPQNLPHREIDALARIVRCRRPLPRGAYLFQAGSRFRSIFAIRTGAVKTATLLPNGSEHISGFHLPGEILGLDAIDGQRHPSASVTLEKSSICEIPFIELEHLGQHTPALQRRLLRIMSRELTAEHGTAHLLSRRSAEQRLAAALLDLSKRFAHRGLHAERLRLPMSRLDLANYLGLAPETMSRTVRRLEQRGLLRIVGKEVALSDIGSLQELAHGTHPIHYAP